MTGNLVEKAFYMALAYKKTRAISTH